MTTFVYALNDGCDRQPLWHYLSSISTTFPWCILGYFNCVLSMDEIQCGREHWTPDMQQFKECIESYQLDHIHTLGDLLTWSNNRPIDQVFRRLDRALSNATWLLTFT